ncbi:MAG: ABC transporter permease [Spirochaetes bacterium]|nr:ABC transporter permease [Spirochaetota bacterium]
MKKNKSCLPRLPYWLLKKTHILDFEEGYSGDIEEEYQNIRSLRGHFKAVLWIWNHALLSIPKCLKLHFFSWIEMLIHYFKNSLRYMRQHKSYSLINITGLAVGIACCLLILSWIQYELSYDRFHTNAREIYRVISEFHSPGGEINYTATNQAPLAAALKENFPEIINSARALRRDWKIGKQSEQFTESVWFVDASFLDVFLFNFIQGNPTISLSEPNSVILTESLAKKQFQNENPMGKTVIGGQRTPFFVSGVIKDIPQNSHLDIDAIIPLQLLAKAGHNLTEWGGYNYRTYIQLQKGRSKKDIQQKVKYILKEYAPETKTTIQLQPLTKIHLYALEGGGLITYIYIFLTMAVFILLIACVNYINLATARSSARAKEVGIRQVVGARREQLISQFLCESFLLSLVATFFALVLAHIFLPIFQRLAGKEISISYSLESLGLVVGIAALTGIISGSYPAFVLSHVKPIKILKGIFRGSREGVFFRKVLVISQFALSIFFIFGTLTISQQIHLLLNKNLGYDKENIICLNTLDGIAQNYSAIKNGLMTNPNIVGMTVVDSFLDEPNSSASSDVISWEGQKADENLPWLVVRGVDFDFQKTFGIKMAEGRFFSREFPSDSEEGMVVNEAAVKAMNMDSPLGKKFHFWDYDGIIIGVIKNFHYRSLHKNIEPMVMKVGINLQRIALRIKGEDITSTLRFIETEIKKIVPNYPFELEFLDEKLNRLYKAEERMENITQAISFLALFISCLGLVGLAAYTAEQKTKEIGIRKVLGASTNNITLMLYKNYIHWIIAANLIAWPLGFYFVNRWLRNFAYKIDISIWIFLIPSALVFFIAFLTVSFQSIRAAKANPIDSLRYE